MKWKNLMVKLVALLVVSCFLAVPAFGAQDSQALAAGYPSKASGVTATHAKLLENWGARLPKSGTYYMVKMPYEGSPNDFRFDTVDPLEVTSIKSSNASMIDFDSMVDVNPRFSVVKPGTTTISYKMSNGKSYSFVLKAIKYANPVKKLKIGDRNYASKVRSDDWKGINKEYLVGKVSVKAKPGWALKKITVEKYNSKSPTNYTAKKVKNNKKLTKNSKVKYLHVTFKNKKSKVVQTVTVAAEKWPDVPFECC